MCISKSYIREFNRGKRKNLKDFELCVGNNIINTKIIKLLGVFDCYKVLLYKSFDQEVSLDGVFKFCITCGKEVYYPKVLGGEINFYRIKKLSEFDIGKYNILEPKFTGEKEKLIIEKKFTYIVFVPGIAFDIFGNRVGFGKGYYDKFLNNIFLKNEIDRDKVFVVGVCYDSQVYKDKTLDLLKSSYDFPMDLVVTDKIFIVRM